jgi:hypothetical protein
MSCVGTICIEIEQLSRVVLYASILLMAQPQVNSNCSKWKLYGKLKHDVTGKILNTAFDVYACTSDIPLLVVSVSMISMTRSPLLTC